MVYVPHEETAESASGISAAQELGKPKRLSFTGSVYIVFACLLACIIPIILNLALAASVCIDKCIFAPPLLPPC